MPLHPSQRPFIHHSAPLSFTASTPSSFIAPFYPLQRPLSFTAPHYPSQRPLSFIGSLYFSQVIFILHSNLYPLSLFPNPEQLPSILHSFPLSFSAGLPSSLTPSLFLKLPSILHNFPFSFTLSIKSFTTSLYPSQSPFILNVFPFFKSFLFPSQLPFFLHNFTRSFTPSAYLSKLHSILHNFPISFKTALYSSQLLYFPSHVHSILHSFPLSFKTSLNPSHHYISSEPTTLPNSKPYLMVNPLRYFYKCK